MNNKCEFRVWDKYTGKFLESNDVALCANGSMIMFNQYNAKDNQWTRNHLEKETIVQFWTGVIDVNGKKVFEGDIVNWEDWDDGYGHDNDPIEKGKGTVKWGNHSYCGYTWGWTIENHKNSYSIGLTVKRIEVIGNIINKPTK